LAKLDGDGGLNEDGPMGAVMGIEFFIIIYMIILYYTSDKENNPGGASDIIILDKGTGPVWIDRR
jgi:hypothetical protein